MFIEWFSKFSPVTQGTLAGCFAWFATALGAALVFPFKTINRRLMDTMLGFAGGIMLAAAFWSLLQPAIEICVTAGRSPWIVPLIGFLVGGAFLYVADKVIPHLHILPSSSDGKTRLQPEGPESKWHRSILLVLAVTLHNIPEGLAIGVAFGAIGVNVPGATLGGALALALGIAIQDFPEGAAVSIPLRRENLSRRRAFMYGQASGLVEPFAALVGALAVLKVQNLLPYALAFAAGAMVYVVIEEIIPEAQQSRDSDMATIGAMIGFALMMVLDVALA